MSEGGIHTVIYQPGGVGGPPGVVLPQGPGDRLTMISRRYANLLREFGIGIFGIAGEHWRLGTEFVVHANLEEVAHPIDRVIITVPTFAMEDTAWELSRCAAITERTRVYLFMNGWLNANPIERVIRKNQLFNAAVMLGALRRSPNTIQVIVNAGIQLGSLYGASLDDAEELAADLSKGGLPTRTTSEIGTEIFKKLAFNCVGALSAPYRMPLGGLLQPAFRSRVQNIAIETWQASIDVGHRSFDTEGEAIEDVFNRIRIAAAHTASITKALANRQQTEIDSFVGAVVKISQQHGWMAEESARVWEEVRLAESSRTNVFLSQSLAGVA